MSPQLDTFLIALTPIAGLRASIPIAITLYQMSIWQSYLFSVLGSLIPPIFILWGLDALSNYLSKKIYFFNRFFAWLFKRTHHNHQKGIEKWKEWALVIFVAIPLPLSGVWTSSLVAFVFDIPFKKAYLLITLGMLIMGLIVTGLTLFFT